MGGIVCWSNILDVGGSPEIKRLALDTDKDIFLMIQKVKTQK